MEMNEAERFIRIEVPQLLDQLTAEVQPRWGSMDASAMMHHLADTIRISLEDKPRTILAPPEKLEALHRFLLSDRPFAQGLPMPANFTTEGKPTGDFKASKAYLLEQLAAFHAHFQAQPHFTSIHMAFGRLDYNLWIHLMAKHFKHHLTQFGLLE
jgi:oxepin-CoA hydrolase/3-oxo-5,6-dehydrosuberyl-CoA semialdehyde dehydrogenase